MADQHNIPALTKRLQRRGVRQLLVVSGEAEWGQQQVQQWISMLPGDWLWVGDTPQSPLHCTPQTARTLLGREYLHAVFDARHGFNAEALAILSGTLKAGSWLLLLAPVWENWATQPDKDSLRWSEMPAPIATPNFIGHLQKILMADPQVAMLRQHHAPLFPSQPEFALWQPDNHSQQQRLLEQLLKSKPGIFVVMAARGRGKSALAGSLAFRWPGRCLISAPAKVATDVLAKFAGAAFEFIAPDRLLALKPDERPEDVDWLLVDEAAAIPTPLLEQLVRLYPRVLLTTTLQGYEGTGRGFLLKFCASLPDATLLKLDRPLRWSEQDSLEPIIARALLFSEAEPAADNAEIRFSFPQQAEWQSQSEKLEAIYRLLTSAHYRTSPLDLRRMMDAPGMHFSTALQREEVRGALWLVDEGGLPAELAAAVWAGLRRPAGNLVAQSLAAHAGCPEAAQMSSRRISRIAITPALQRRGIGQRMVRQSIEQAKGLDFFSVSFGYTEPLWQFWQSCGFRLVRFGSRPEASSGCYTAMAVLPLSKQGKVMADKANHRLILDWPWLQPLLGGVNLCLPGIEPVASDQEEWRELAGFAWGQRSFEAGIGALGRLLSYSPEPLPLLQVALQSPSSQAERVQQTGLSGRKALLNGWRLEVQRALTALDATRSEEWQRTLQSLRAGS